MIKKHIFLSILLTSFCVLLSIPVVGQAQESAETDPWTRYMTPGAIHDLLSGHTGEWEVEIAMHHEGREPIITVASCSIKPIYDSRFLQLSQSGNMMGMDYQTTTIMGFNRADDKFEVISYTNLGTGILYLQGSWVNEDRSAVVSGTLANPVNKEPVYVKQIITFLEKDNFTIENYDNSTNGEKRLTIVYKFKRKS